MTSQIMHYTFSKDSHSGLCLNNPPARLLPQLEDDGRRCSPPFCFLPFAASFPQLVNFSWLCFVFFVSVETCFHTMEVCSVCRLYREISKDRFSG